MTSHHAQQNAPSGVETSYLGPLRALNACSLSSKKPVTSSVDQETQQTDDPGAGSVVEDAEGSVVEDPATLGTVDTGDPPSVTTVPEDAVDEVIAGRVGETGGTDGSSATPGGAASPGGTGGET